MNKLLKPLIIAMLLLSVGALILGSMLYSKREKIKGRTQKLEAGVIRIAEILMYDRLNQESLRDYALLDGQLSPLVTTVKNMHGEQSSADELLNQVKERLQQTTHSLEIAQSELRVSKKDAAEYKSTIEYIQAKISQNEEEVVSLESKKEELSNKIAKVENDLLVTQDSLTDVRAEYANLNSAFEDCVTESVGTSTKGTVIAGDFEGKILVVNPEWNIVVIDMGSENEMTDNAILLVHRDAKPIGKIQVNLIRERIAVAEIMTSWDGCEFHPGDRVIAPKSS